MCGRGDFKESRQQTQWGGNFPEILLFLEWAPFQEEFTQSLYTGRCVSQLGSLRDVCPSAPTCECTNVVTVEEGSETNGIGSTAKKTLWIRFCEQVSQNRKYPCFQSLGEESEVK